MHCRPREFIFNFVEMAKKKSKRNGEINKIPLVNSDSELENYGGGGEDSDDSVMRYEKSSLKDLQDKVKGKKRSSAASAGSGKRKAAFNVGQDSESDSEHEHDAKKSKMEQDYDSDLEDEYEAAEPLDEIRRWGKKKKSFYGGGEELDDEDEDRELAEDMAQETALLQMKQLQELDEEDFQEAFAKESKGLKTRGGADEKIKLDVSNLSSKEKNSLFKRENPEFEGITSDFVEKLTEAKNVLEPLLDLMKRKLLSSSGAAARYIKLKYQLILNYCTNISCYVMFKSRKINVQHHKLSARLVQYKTLLDVTLKPLNDSILPELVALNQKLEQGANIKKLIKEEKLNQQKNKRLNVLSHEIPQREQEIYNEKEIDENDDEDEDEEEEQRRSINYQIAKNKGLTPKRSKAQRNPRVKHRQKFEKAKVKRKGQVREVRKETKKYGGEMFGINARVKKGIKLQ